ncbi:hypothetical protein CLOP_g5566 [Closterium sp. NIES-67]|nr:hypothetical protein CLOP_g5566 [Closterium sp. NIES-67]
MLRWRLPQMSLLQRVRSRLYPSRRQVSRGRRGCSGHEAAVAEQEAAVGGAGGVETVAADGALEGQAVTAIEVGEGEWLPLLQLRRGDGYRSE